LASIALLAELAVNIGVAPLFIAWHGLVLVAVLAAQLAVLEPLAISVHKLLQMRCNPLAASDMLAFLASPHRGRVAVTPI
jgi:hypothetical protein